MKPWGSPLDLELGNTLYERAFDVEIAESIIGKIPDIGLPHQAVRLYCPLVKNTPPEVLAHPRRKRSRQREGMLEWLRETDSHPTAAEIHARLLPEMPSLSLATVYRNLEVLVADGDLDEVQSGIGAARYDGNLEPHHHFNCECCGRILDIDLPTPRGLVKRLSDAHGLASRRVRMSFFGLCRDCGRGSEDDTAGESVAKGRSRA